VKGNSSASEARKSQVSDEPVASLVQVGFRKRRLLKFKMGSGRLIDAKWILKGLVSEVVMVFNTAYETRS
jgi:hypothetical protein